MSVEPARHSGRTEPLDFAPMYATHNAFRRDLTRLHRAVDDGRTDTPGVRAGWANFTRQLAVHHSVEDEVLWPALRRAVPGRPRDLALIAEMAAEHAQLDPLLEAIDHDFAHRKTALAEHIRELTDVLETHTRHEEDAALPLMQEVLPAADWAAFRSAMAARQGPSGAAVYVPWILDGATAEQRRDFLAAMPRPLAVVNTLLFQPRYRRRHLWE
ncbi:hemerythrin domain-containing protein [Nocardia sp. BMG111209]|uniref:hemerythrin domain-containing protein n=1 Tax=Nocardia sp. BMG111209 TaxID=1160137 RepID=UPI00037BBE2A|nr:hemerythrin domain-containing protein [Nocardia sp. BMG111209]